MWLHRYDRYKSLMTFRCKSPCPIWLLWQSVWCMLHLRSFTHDLVYRRHRTPQSVWTVSSAYLRNLKFFPKRFQRPCLCTPNGWPHRKRKSYVFSLNRLSTIVTTALNSTNVVIINGHDRFYTLYSNSNLCPKPLKKIRIYIGRSRRMRHFEWSTILTAFRVFYKLNFWTKIEDLAHSVGTKKRLFFWWLVTGEFGVV